LTFLRSIVAAASMAIGACCTKVTQDMTQSTHTRAQTLLFETEHSAEIYVVQELLREHITRVKERDVGTELAHSRQHGVQKVCCILLV
jgi:hypothetical protein